MFPSAILLKLEKILLGTDSLFNLFACLISLIPGRIGSFLRVAYYSHTLEHCSKDVTISFGSFFSQRQASIGRFVSIGEYVILGKVNLGDHVQIASKVSITSGKHQHITEDTLLTKVSIGEKAWIGEGAIVMDDVGRNSILGAGSVVVRAIPDYHVAAGNPARPIRKTRT